MEVGPKAINIGGGNRGNDTIPADTPTTKAGESPPDRHPMEKVRARKGAARKSLTRSDMEEIIKRGESVMVVHPELGYTVIDKVEDLPDEADLAAGDEEAEQNALDVIQAQRAHLDAQEKRLMATRTERSRAARATAADEVPPEGPPLPKVAPGEVGKRR